MENFNIGRLSIEFHEQWSYFFTGANWYDLTIIKLEVEYEANMGYLRSCLWILGVGVDISLDIGSTPDRDELISRINLFERNDK